MKRKDYCTWFPEFWLQWYKTKYFIPFLRKVYIGDCCKIHDEKCSTSAFIKCLWKKHIFVATLITAGGYIGCVPQKIYSWLKKNENNKR